MTNEMNKRSPMVSICCITYNHENYIKDAIEGFLMQKVNFSFEIIIYDDASTDKTSEIIKQYEEKYPELFLCIYQNENQYSRGVRGIAAKFTFPHVTGKYISLCEGDDYWIDPYKLQKQVDFLENYPDYGMVHTDFDEVNIRQNTIVKNYNKTRNISIPEGNIFLSLLGPTWLIHTLTIMVRTSIVKEFIEFIDENIEESSGWVFGDIPMFLFISINSKVKYLDDSTSVYRILQESLSHSNSIMKVILNNIALINVKLFFINKFKITDTEIKAKLQINLVKVELKRCYMESDYKLGFKYVLFLVKNNALNIKDLIFFVGTIYPFAILFRHLPLFNKYNLQ